MSFLIGLLSGLLFGTGLVVAQMTDPARVLGFLDVLGRWDPRLAFVMVGAITVHAPFVAWFKRRGKLIAAVQLDLPNESRINRQLVSGAVLFGLGWGLVGYCPGPAIVAAVSSRLATVFTLSMLVGMWLFDRLMAGHGRHSKLQSGEPLEPA